MKAYAQNALAGLRKWQLVRDDESDPGGRVYRDGAGNVYASVTRILSATAPPEQKAALERWLERPTSEAERSIAAERGTLAHNNAEYVLKTARKMAIHTANKRGVWKAHEDGLERAPAAITQWATQKAIQGAPRVAWSAAGYARGLRAFIEENVTAIHAVEFSVFAPLDAFAPVAASGGSGRSAARGSERSERPMGFAGTCDALLDVDGTLAVVDWKTSARERSDEMLEGYKCQAGAYSLGLRHLTGIQAPAAAVVVARRSGPAQVRILGASELREYEERFLERCVAYFGAAGA